MDKYLWAVRIFKTRSDAAEAVRNNRVLVNDAYAKPSREVREGDVISVKRPLLTYTYRVKALVINRLPAAKVAEFCENMTPESELAKLHTPRETIFVFRERGTGRHTKKERREIDALMDSFYLEDDED